MQLTIQDNEQLASIQQRFNEMFPYLRIEFYAKKGKNKPVKQEPADPTETFGTIRSVHTSGTLEILPAMSVRELEEILNRDYGIMARVFRKSGKMWLQTSVTDKWTLEHQNNEGKALSGNSIFHG